MKKIFIFSIVLLLIAAPRASALLFVENTYAVIEPATLLLLGLGLIGIAVLRRKGVL